MVKAAIRNDSHTKGDIGETATQLIFRKFGWTADVISSDYGEDLDCNIFINAQRTNLHFRCQVKYRGKNSKYVKELKSDRYSVNIETSIIQTWISCMFPVFLIIYDEVTESMFWSVPMQQIMKAPKVLGQKKISIHVEKKRLLTPDSRDKILKEVQSFYNKLLRLDSARIECQVIPVIMPKYRVLSTFRITETFDISRKSELTIEADMLDPEMLPSWITVLQRLEPLPYIPSITVSSSATDIEQYLNLLHGWLKNFKLKVSEQEWISFIITPIKVISDDGLTSPWINELTYWTSYSLINDKLVADYDYTFLIEGNLVSQVARRARSWEYYHKVDVENDIAIDFYGSINISPAIKSQNFVHARNIKWQYILWTCKANELGVIQKIITENSEESENSLSIKILDEKSNGNIVIVIADSFFDPFRGSSSSPSSWEDFDNDIISRLRNNGKLEILPGNIYSDEAPEHFKSAIKQYERDKVEFLTIRERNSIAGFPIRHNDRLIHVVRLQMIDKATLKIIEENFLRISKEIKNSKTLSFCDFTFTLVDDTWWEPIYELSASWHPNINQSSNDSLKSNHATVLKIFNSIMPTVKNKKNKRTDTSIKNTLEILTVPGEIFFEKNRTN